MYHIMGNIIQLDRGITEGEETQGSSGRICFKLEISFERVVCHNDLSRANIILALKVILLDRLQGINCSVIQEPYLLGFML